MWGRTGRCSCAVVEGGAQAARVKVAARWREGRVCRPTQHVQVTRTDYPCTAASHHMTKPLVSPVAMTAANDDPLMTLCGTDLHALARIGAICRAWEGWGALCVRLQCICSTSTGGWAPLIAATSPPGTTPQSAPHMRRGSSRTLTTTPPPTPTKEPKAPANTPTHGPSSRAFRTTAASMPASPAQFEGGLR